MASAGLFHWCPGELPWQRRSECCPLLCDAELIDCHGLRQGLWLHPFDGAVVQPVVLATGTQLAAIAEW
jgi:hypothetical protein